MVHQVAKEKKNFLLLRSNNKNNKERLQNKRFEKSKK